MKRKNIYLLRALCPDKLVIRFNVNGTTPSERDIDYAWNEIETQTNEICKQHNVLKTNGVNNNDWEIPERL